MIEVKTIFDKQMMVRVAQRISRSCMLFLAVVSLLTACGSTTVPAWQEQYDLGMQYLTDDDYASAIVAFTASIETGPKLAALYIARGDAYSAWAEETEAAALESFSDGETLEWSEITVSTDDGSTYTIEDLYENAISDYEEAAELLQNGEAMDQSDDLLEEVKQKRGELKTKQEVGMNEFARELIELAEELLDDDPSEEKKKLAGQCLEAALELTDDEELVMQIEDIYTETGEGDNSIIFQEKIKELVNIYGVFTEEQSGIMQTGFEEWFDPTGILGATIFDFDADGSLEMMICIAEEHADSGNMTYYEYYDYDIFMYMYEIENGVAVVSDKMYFGAYMESEYSHDTRIGLGFNIDLWYGEFMAVNILEINGRIYIVCEAKMIASAFGDGLWQSYWIVQYNGSAFQYVSSLTSPGVGSGYFEFYAYHFENGIVTGSDFYYTDQYGAPVNGLYDRFGQALQEYFNNYDIEITDSAATYERASYCGVDLQSMLAASNNILEVLSFTNLLTEYNYDLSSNTITAEFSANLIRGNDLLNGF